MEATSKPPPPAASINFTGEFYHGEEIFGTPVLMAAAAAAWQTKVKGKRKGKGK